MKISQKLILGFTGIALSIGAVGGIALYYQNKIIGNNVFNEIKAVEKNFLTLRERDTKILSSALEVFVQDQAFKDVYLEKDREKLYNYGQPLFQELKNKYGITHFYFIRPDGHCFVRLHDKNIYEDLIKRITFRKARDTKKMASGIELGKTAFALRVVSPYYNNNELIGYVEFGEEIYHFLEILKGKTNNEFAIFADKNDLDRQDWKSVRQVAGLRDNWDDLEDHVIIVNTLKEEIKAKTDFFIEKNLDSVEKGKTLIQQVQSGKDAFIGGGFEIIDAGGQHIGAVLILIDITDSSAIAQKANFATLSIAIILFSISLGLSFSISHSILKPVRRLIQATIRIGKGDFNTKIEIERKDEIGTLANAFNNMTKNFNKTCTSIEILNNEIAERKKAEDALKEAYEKLKETHQELIQVEKMATLGTLSAGMVHEINNPLMGVMLLVQNMISEKKEGAEDHKTLLQIEEGLKRIANVTSKLLVFSRKEKLVLEKTRINDIIEMILPLVSHVFDLDGIELVKDYGKDLPSIEVSVNEIQQVLMNILLNAKDALIDSKSKKITITTCLEKDTVRMKIKDEGCGIKKENLEKIFVPFFTTKSAGKGLGMGMFIAKGIMDQHGGKIDIYSEEQKGTEVILSLPVAGETRKASHGSNTYY